MSVLVAHPGKQHVYQTVLAAQSAGQLHAFATGVYLDSGSRPARAALALSRRFRGAGLLRSVAGRSHPEIDGSKVVTFPYWGSAARLTWALPFGAGFERWASARTDALIARWLASLSDCPEIVHGFEGYALATFGVARRRGMTTILDVSNGHEYVRRELSAEAGEPAVAGMDTERVRAERALADVLIAPSDWVVDCLLENGVDRARIVKIPFGGDPNRVTPERRSDDVFRAVFVGVVGLRKGVRYLLEAWRRLALPNAELVVVGGGADAWGRSAAAEYAGVARFEGQRPAADVDRWLSRSDVFVFPSLAEGSAIVTYEALAAGLPVVTTPNAGSVVRDGVDGFIVAPRDVDALCDRLLYLYEHRDRAKEMGERGRTAIRSAYTWSHYHARVAELYGCVAREKGLTRVHPSRQSAA